MLKLYVVICLFIENGCLIIYLIDSVLVRDILSFVFEVIFRRIFERVLFFWKWILI